MLMRSEEENVSTPFLLLGPKRNGVEPPKKKARVESDANPPCLRGTLVVIAYAPAPFSYEVGSDGPLVCAAWVVIVGAALSRMGLCPDPPLRRWFSPG